MFNCCAYGGLPGYATGSDWNVGLGLLLAYDLQSDVDNGGDRVHSVKQRGYILS